MAISKRLKTVLSFVQEKSLVCADVGCDHGKLVVELVKQKGVHKVFASDVSEPSLNKTKQTAAEQNLKNVACIFCDGLTNYPINEVYDYVIIAGIGEGEIEKIIKCAQNTHTVKNYILQPMQEAQKLRKFLLSGGYEIQRDETIEDNGKFYSVILCGGKTGTPQKYENKDLWFGKTDLNEMGSDFLNKLIRDKEHLTRRINYLTQEEQDKLEFIIKILKR